MFIPASSIVFNVFSKKSLPSAASLSASSSIGDKSIISSHCSTVSKALAPAPTASNSPSVVGTRSFSVTAIQFCCKPILYFLETRPCQTISITHGPKFALISWFHWNTVDPLQYESAGSSSVLSNLCMATPTARRGLTSYSNPPHPN